MPDYKLEMKRAIFEKNLKDGRERENFLLMMNVLSGRTPQEYIDICQSRLEKAEQEDALFTARARVEQDKIDRTYNAEVQKVRETYNSEVEYLGAEAPLLASSLENIAKRKEEWRNASPLSIEEMWDKVYSQDKKHDGESYKKTEAYQNLPEYQQITFESYYNSRKTCDSIRGSEQMTPAINAARMKRDDAIKSLTFKKPDLLKKPSPSYDDIIMYKGNIQQMTSFKNYQYEQMLNVKVGNISEEAKQAGTDFLTAARAEYKNKYNLWQRMWANILPSSLYGPAKDVEKINAYKETLQEAGFSEKEIENADPEKSDNYIYDKNTKQYVKQERLSAAQLKDQDEIPMEAEKENVVKGRQQSEEFVSELGERTSENKETGVQKKTEKNEKGLINDAPGIGGKIN